MQCREDIPVPDTVAGEQEMVAVPLVVAAKLALYTAMREQGLTKVGLARRLGLSEGAVRKLLNPNHRSHIGQIERALVKVGRRLVAEDATVVISKTFRESDPVQLTTVLAHDANGDSCEAWLTESLVFDLALVRTALSAALRTRFGQGRPSNHGCVR